MLKITDRWYVDTDPFQFIVYEKTTTKTGKNPGKESLVARAYCGTLTQLKNWLMNREIMDDNKMLKNIKECERLSRTIDREIVKLENIGE